MFLTFVWKEINEESMSFDIPVKTAEIGVVYLEVCQ